MNLNVKLSDLEFILYERNVSFHLLISVVNDSQYWNNTVIVICFYLLKPFKDVLIYSASCSSEVLQFANSLFVRSWRKLFKIDVFSFKNLQQSRKVVLCLFFGYWGPTFWVMFGDCLCCLLKKIFVGVFMVILVSLWYFEFFGPSWYFLDLFG